MRAHKTLVEELVFTDKWAVNDQQVSRDCLPFETSTDLSGNG